MIGRLVAVIAAAAVCAWGSWRYAYEPVACTLALTRLTRSTNAIDPSRISDYDRALRARDNVTQLLALHCPNDVRVPWLIAVNKEYLGQYEEAIAAYRAALAIDQRPEIYAALGAALIQAGRVEEAIDQYATAAEFNPVYLERLNTYEMVERVKARMAARR